MKEDIDPWINLLCEMRSWKMIFEKELKVIK